MRPSQGREPVSQWRRQKPRICRSLRLDGSEPTEQLMEGGQPPQHFHTSRRKVEKNQKGPAAVAIIQPTPVNRTAASQPTRSQADQRRTTALRKTSRSALSLQGASGSPLRAVSKLFVCQFKVSLFGSVQFKVAEIVSLRKVCPSSLNIKAYSKCDLKMQPCFQLIPSASLVDFAHLNIL